MRRVLLIAATAAAGLAVGAFSLTIAREQPAFSLVGTSPLRTAVLLAVGYALFGVGLAAWWRPQGGRLGLLLAAAGLAWLVAEWNNPGNPSGLAFTVGLCLAAACPPLAGHAVLGFPAGRLSAAAERWTIAVAYVGAVLLLGLLPALAFDAQAQGCGECPANLVSVTDEPSAVERLNRAGVYAGVGWAAALCVLALLRFARGPAAVRPVAAAGGVYLAFVAAMFAVSLERGLLSTGTAESRIWLGQAAALAGVALGIVWSWARSRRARKRVAALVVGLASSPPPGGLRDVLAETVGDPQLVLGYPVGDDGRLVDARGRPIALAGLARTSLVGDGREVAVLGHRPGLLDDDQLVDEVVAASRLALENERLQAEAAARVEELRASRARIVDAGDAERRRLERDLHDGAQQRLVALSLTLRLLRGQVSTGATAASLDEADAELRAATADLRELAHGIFPAVLADEGLAAAIEDLAEGARIPVRIDGLPAGRLPAGVETAAYTIVAEAAKVAGGPLTVDAVAADGLLRLEVRMSDGHSLDLVALEDRIGALDGRLQVAPREDGTVTIIAELPCAS
jgi:signal transduction histidine kinase